MKHERTPYVTGPDGVLPPDPNVELKPGAKVLVSIRGRDDEGNYLLSTIKVEVPRDWSGLKSPWLRPLILCGQHSLEIFCLGVFLAFAGHFILAEVGGGAPLHALISLGGILIMCGVAWVISWYKQVADKSAARKGAVVNADLAGGG